MESTQLITKAQTEMIINSMSKQYSKFKKFKYNHWKKGKLLCFKITSNRLPNGFQNIIGECTFNNKNGIRDRLMPQYSKYVYFPELEEEYCITLLENAKWEFKVVPTDIQISNKYKTLIEEITQQGRAKLIEATDLSIKLKLLKQ